MRPIGEALPCDGRGPIGECPLLHALVGDADSRDHNSRQHDFHRDGAVPVKCPAQPIQNKGGRHEQALDVAVLVGFVAGGMAVFSPAAEQLKQIATKRSAGGLESLFQLASKRSRVNPVERSDHCGC